MSVKRRGMVLIISHKSLTHCMLKSVVNQFIDYRFIAIFFAYFILLQLIYRCPSSLGLCVKGLVPEHNPWLKIITSTKVWCDISSGMYRYVVNGMYINSNSFYYLICNNFLHNIIIIILCMIFIHN